MGKQWLSHYSSIGERGGIETRAAERQRKFDGLQTWHLRTVLEFIPILLQASLLFFGLGLSAYIYDQQHIVAAIAIIVNGVGAIFYFAVVGLSLRYPDSPFQTPLSSMLLRGYTATYSWVSAALPTITRPAVLVASRVSQCARHIRREVLSPIAVGISRALSVMRGILRLNSSSPLGGQQPDVEKASDDPSHLLTSALRIPQNPTAPTLVEDSEEWKADRDMTSAVIWLLDTSTDPVVFFNVMRTIPELHWAPAAVKLLPIEVLDRILDQIYSCFRVGEADFERRPLKNASGGTVTVLITTFLFIYWEKFAVHSSQIKKWVVKLRPQFLARSSFHRALRRYRSEGELGRVLELLRWTLSHAESVKRYTDPNRDTQSRLQIPLMLSAMHQTSTGSSVSHVRTAFYLAQQAQCYLGAPDFTYGWEHRRNLLECVGRFAQRNVLFSEDRLMMAVLACTTVAVGDLPQLTLRKISLQISQRYVTCISWPFLELIVAKVAVQRCPLGDPGFASTNGFPREVHGGSILYDKSSDLSNHSCWWR